MLDSITCCRGYLPHSRAFALDMNVVDLNGLDVMIEHLMNTNMGVKKIRKVSLESFTRIIDDVKALYQGFVIIFLDFK